MRWNTQKLRLVNCYFGRLISNLVVSMARYKDLHQIFEIRRNIKIRLRTEIIIKIVSMVELSR